MDKIENKGMIDYVENFPNKDNIIMLEIEVSEGKKSKIWMNRIEYEAQKKWFAECERQMARWWYLSIEEQNREREIRNKRTEGKRNLKWCYVLEGNTKKHAMIDINTSIVYKVDGYKSTNIKSKGKFIKYLTMMDL